MNNPDVIYTLTSRLDNSALQLLSTTSLWNEIKKASTDQLWWYLRVQQLLGTTLERRLVADWKEVYRVLLPAVTDKEASSFTREVIANPLAVSVLLESGVDPSRDRNDALVSASTGGYTETVKLLLSDPRVIPSNGGRYVIGLAVIEDHAEIVKLLLEHGKFNPSDDDNYPIRAAVERGRVEIAKLLLADPRVDPSSQDNDLLGDAVFSKNVELVRLLLSHPKVDPSAVNNYSIRAAALPEIIKLLLADPRVDPTVDDYEPIRKAIRFDQPESLTLLLDDGRISLSPVLLRELLSDTRTLERPKLAFILASHIKADLQYIDDKSLLYYTIKSSVDSSPDIADSLEGTVKLSRGLKREGILNKLATNNFEQDHYYIFLRELLLKRRDLHYCFSWLLEQCSRHPQAVEYRRVIAEAAESYRETGRVIHTSALFTAYSGFLLLAKSSNAQAILNTLTQEGASEEGLQLAGMLIGAYLGKRGVQ